MTVAQNSVGDRLGALQEKAVRTIAVWKGHVGGYGRAAVSNAISIVWRPEPKKTPNRPRLGKEGTAAGSNGYWLAVGTDSSARAVDGAIRGGAVIGATSEHFPVRFRV